MSWVKLDDGMPDSLKIAPLSDAAFRAYVTSICYAARSLSDGFMPMKKAKEFAGKARVIQELVPSLWEVADGGFTVHDYLQYNPTRETVLRERGAAKERMIAARSGNVRANNGRTSPEVQLPRTPSPSRPKEIQQPPPALPPSLDNVDADVVVPVVRAFERCFGRLLSPMEIESIKALDEEHPRERIDYALREAAELGKRSVRYIQSICENQSRNGDDHERKQVGRNGGSAPQVGDAATELARWNGGFAPVYVPDAGADDERPSPLVEAHDPARLEVGR